MTVTPDPPPPSPPMTTVDLSTVGLLYGTTYANGKLNPPAPSSGQWVEIAIPGLIVDFTTDYEIQVDIEVDNPNAGARVQLNSLNAAADPNVSSYYTLSSLILDPPVAAGTVILRMGPTYSPDWADAQADGEIRVDLNARQPVGTLRVTALRYGMYASDPVDPPPTPVEPPADDAQAGLLLSVLDTTLDQAPTTVVVSVSNAEPNELLTFRIDGVLAYATHAMPSGTLGVTSIPVDEAVGGQGVHTLTVTSQGGETASGTFTMRRNPNPLPTVRGPDTAPVEIPGVYRPNGARRWVLQDLMPGGLGSYILPVNPTEMGNPAFERGLNAKHTTAVNSGRFHLYEAGRKPLDWTFSGYCPTQEMHDKLKAFGNLNRRFYLIDHRGRAWVVTFSSVDMVARKRQANIYGDVSDWAHDYTVTGFIHKQTAVLL